MTCVMRSPGRSSCLAFQPPSMSANQTPCPRTPRRHAAGASMPLRRRADVALIRLERRRRDRARAIVHARATARQRESSAGRTLASMRGSIASYASTRLRLGARHLDAMPARAVVVATRARTALVRRREAGAQLVVDRRRARVDARRRSSSLSSQRRNHHKKRMASAISR